MFSVICLSACSPVALYQAENAYEAAKVSKSEKLILAALKSLATLDPLLYQSKFDDAKSASLELQQAKVLLAEQNIYPAYLAAHNSYRKLPTKESKEVLLKVGGQLKYLLEVQSNIIKSFDSLPTSISGLLSTYENQSVLEWDVIKINSVLEQLGLARKAINNSLTLLEKKKGAILLPEIAQWQLAIEHQAEMIEQVEHYLINLALSSSARVLKKLNVQLTQNSENLLSLVREELAYDTMGPHFISANNEYQLYFNLNENLSLASSSARHNSHAVWYKEWHDIEKSVLERISPFSSYPKGSLNRENTLNSFTKEENNIRPDLKLGFSNLTLLMSEYETAYNLIEKLSRDRMLLNYG